MANLPPSPPSGDRRRAPPKAQQLRDQGYPKPVADVVGVIVGAVLVHLAIHLFHFIAEVSTLMAGGSGVRAHMPQLASAYEASFFIYFVAAPFGCVAWFAWIDRTVKNLYAAGITRLDRTPMQMVMAYMIPGVNLSRPHGDLQRLYRAVRAGNGWTRVPRQPVIRAWWAASLVQLTLMFVELLTGFSAISVWSSAASIATATLALAVLRCFAQVQAHWRPPSQEVALAT